MSGQDHDNLVQLTNRSSSSSLDFEIPSIKALNPDGETVEVNTTTSMYDKFDSLSFMSDTYNDDESDVESYIVPQVEEKQPRIIRFIHKFKSIPQGLRTWLYIIIGCSLLCIPAVIDYMFFVTKESKENGQFFYYKSTATIGNSAMMYFFLYLSVLWSILIFSQYIFRLIPGFCIRITKFFFGRKHAEIIRAKVEYIGQLHAYISYMITFTFASVLWNVFFTAYDPYVSTIGNIISCCFLVQYIAVSFHERAYKDRLIENKFMEYVIETLFEARRLIKERSKKKRGSTQQAFIKNPFMKKSADNLSVPQQQEEINHSLRSPNLSRQSSYNDISINISKFVPESASQPKPVAENNNTKTSKLGISKKFSFINTLSEVTGVKSMLKLTSDVIKDVSSATLNSIINGNSGITDIQSAEQARRLAKYLFDGLVSPGHSDLVLNDFYPIFVSKNDAKRAFRLFDRDGNGDITKEQFKAGCVKYYHDKRSIQRGLRDLGSSVNKLDNILLTIVSLILFLVFLGIFGVSISTYLVTAGTLVLTLSFMIGSSAKNMFDSVIFLFVIHPYDVGDKIQVEGIQYFVRSMSIMVTVCHTLEGQEVYWPNAVLATKNIHNIRRSPDESEALIVYMSITTPTSKIQAFETKLNQFVTQNSRHFHPSIQLWMNGIEEPGQLEPMGKIKMEVWITHKSNFQDSNLLTMRRMKSILAIKDALVDLNIQATVIDKNLTTNIRSNL